MNPPLPLLLLIPLLSAVLALAGWLAWRGSAGLSRKIRLRLLALRLAALTALALMLLNPGRWVRPVESRPRPWLVLVDHSSSMAGKSGTATRAAAAGEYVRKVRAAAEKSGLPLRVQPFAAGLAAPLAADAALPPADGNGSQILTSATRALEEAAAAGETPSGIVIVSDGRSTDAADPGALEAFSLRARAGQSPVYAAAPGAGEPAPDLILTTPRQAITVFAGQPVKVPWQLENSGTEAIRQDVILTGPDGKQAGAQPAEAAPGTTARGVFEFQPEGPGRWQIRTAIVPGEARPVNNSAVLNVNVLTSRTRVFLAEGAPYWDSKFLAQLLRQQRHMDVQSVHRLSDQRYFRINSGDIEPSGTSEAVFPETIADMARYDLIVLGKNTDSFLTPERVEALRAFVRDHGGALLFARGRPVTSEMPGLEPLEPVTWAAGASGEFRFLPAADGEAAGLFGQALPLPDAPQWKALPALQDGRRIASIKPFTRVLAEGATQSGSAAGRFPALLVRRYGQGVTGLLNADGMWKWDFYPEARGQGNMYEDFWTQLIQWMASYSEFLPGQDFSLRVPTTRPAAGSTVPLAISWRGGAQPPEPKITLTLPDGTVRDLIPAAAPDASGRPAWRTSFTPDRPGEWKIRVVDPRPDAPPAPDALCTVPAPPAESDDLTADPEFLSRMAEAAGGRLIQPGEMDEFIARTMVAPPPVNRETGAVWKPLWQNAWYALLITALLAAEWASRRRLGLS